LHDLLEFREDAIEVNVLIHGECCGVNEGYSYKN